MCAEKLENFTFLVEILNTCRKIISLWNEDFKNVPFKKLDYHFNYSNDKGFIFSTDEEFRTIIIHENEIIPLNNNHGKQHDFGNYEFTYYTIERIIRKCALILNRITACYPNLKALPPQQTETKTDKLKVPQIALIHFYEGVQITRENAGEIAAKHGYTAKNSGEGLFQDYTNYCSAANRKGKPTPCTPKKLKNKIELFESVVNHLSDNNKQRANDEINILKTIFENEYQ